MGLLPPRTVMLCAVVVIISVGVCSGDVTSDTNTNVTSPGPASASPPSQNNEKIERRVSDSYVQAYMQSHSNKLSNQGPGDVPTIATFSHNHLDSGLVITHQSQGHGPAGPGPVYKGPNHEYLPPKHDYGPPKHEYGPPKHEYGPPKHEYGPPKHEYGPPKHEYGPPKHEYGPPKVYGPPKHEYGPPAHEYGPPKHEYGPPKHEYGPPKHEYGPPHHEYGPPKPVYGPPEIEYGPPSYEYGPPHVHYITPTPGYPPMKPQEHKFDASVIPKIFGSLPFQLFLGKIHYKKEMLYTLLMVILKVVIFHKFIKFVAILCLLLFIPKFKPPALPSLPSLPSLPGFPKPSASADTEADEEQTSDEIMMDALDDEERSIRRRYDTGDERINNLTVFVLESINQYTRKQRSDDSCHSMLCRWQNFLNYLDDKFPYDRLAKMYSGYLTATKTDDEDEKDEREMIKKTRKLLKSK